MAEPIDQWGGVSSRLPHQCQQPVKVPTSHPLFLRGWARCFLVTMVIWPHPRRAARSLQPPLEQRGSQWLVAQQGPCHHKMLYFLNSDFTAKQFQ